MKFKIITIISFLFTVSVLAQQTEMKKVVDELFNLCAANEFKAASEILAAKYEAGNYVQLDYKNSKSKRSADRLLKKIRALLQLSDSYSVKENQKYEENGQTFLLVEVEFISGSQTLRSKLIFVPVNKKYKLVELK